MPLILSAQQGVTALNIAEQRGKVDIVRLLSVRLL
jgi:hypothetical protein